MEIRVGEIVSVRIFGIVEHVGLVTENGTVISNSMRNSGVIEQSLAEFSAGKEVTRSGYPSDLPPSIVVARARSRLGAQWSLVNSNCEHFVNWAHGLKPTSPQLVGVFGLMVIGVFGFLITRRA